MNARLRKATRNRRHFPSEQAASKVLCLAVREQINPKARDANHVAAHGNRHCTSSHSSSRSGSASNDTKRLAQDR
nr:hypothetical protein OG409_36140 [Streptomyces sp. NBC_00974]